MLTVVARFWLTILLVSMCAVLAGARVVAQDGDEATPGAGLEATPETVEPIWFIMFPEGEDRDAYFDIHAEPGSETQFTINIGNGSSIAVDARIYAADAISGTNGGFVVEDLEDEPEAPTTWMDFPEEVYTFEAGETIQRDFLVSVPEGTAPGQYIAGLAIETAEARPMPGDAPLNVKYRLVLPVFITVPGDVNPGFAVTDVTVELHPQASVVRGLIENTGNVLVRPEGVVTLVPASGGTAIDVPVKMESVYAHDSTFFEVVLMVPLPPGEYVVEAELADANTGANATIESDIIRVEEAQEPSPVLVSSAMVTPMPTATEIVFAQVNVTISNNGVPVQGGSVTLQVLRDGELVDEAIIATSLALPNGETTLNQTYIPATGAWEVGTYTFIVVLSVEDAGSGVSIDEAEYEVQSEIIVE